MRAMPRAAAVLALVLFAGVASASVSTADPDRPSADDVAQARTAVASAATAVAEIELSLALQQSELDASWTAVDAAGESYLQTTVDRDAARALSRAADDRLTHAEEQREAARADLGAIALAAYRSGASMDSVSALLSADGLDSYMARSTAIDKLGQRADAAVQRFEAAEIVASTLGSRAKTAAAVSEAAAVAAEQALDAAHQAQADAEVKVAAVAAQRTGLIAELAARRNTSVAVERARQDSLDADRAARADAAARAAHGTGGTIPTPSSSTVPVANPAPTTPPVGTPSAPPVPPAPPATTPVPPAPPVTTPAPPVSTPTPPVSDPYGVGTGTQRGSDGQGQSALAWAVAQVGKPYIWGATGPDGFDCSGLTSQAWRAAGVSISRTSRDQYRQVLKVGYDSMRPGDLIFWGSNQANPSSITHVAMFIGGGQMVEASRPGVPLRVTSIRWAGTMAFAGRP